MALERFAEEKKAGIAARFDVVRRTDAPAQTTILA
jgi:hypothetical protein